MKQKDDAFKVVSDKNKKMTIELLKLKMIKGLQFNLAQEVSGQVYDQLFTKNHNLKCDVGIKSCQIKLMQMMYQ